MTRSLSLLLVFFFSSLHFVYAIGGDIKQPEGTIGLKNSLGQSLSTAGLIANIIAYAIGIAAILGVIGITWGGIEMIISSGQDEKMKKARYMIIYSILGVVLAGLAYGIVNLITNLRI